MCQGAGADRLNGRGEVWSLREEARGQLVDLVQRGRALELLGLGQVVDEAPDRMAVAPVVGATPAGVLSMIDRTGDADEGVVGTQRGIAHFCHNARRTTSC